MSKQLMKRMWSEDEGGNAVEYGLVAGVIAIALIAGLVIFRNQLLAMFNRAGNAVQANT